LTQTTFLNITFPFCEISIDFNSKYIDTIDLSILPPFLHLKSIDSLNKNQNYEKFNYIMVANYAACSHCKFYDKYPNLMIIHVFDKKDAYNRSTMLSYKTKYKKCLIIQQSIFAKIL
jgi:hypothetical protein